MPKSKRSKVVHRTQVTKKTRADKDRLFDEIRDCISNYPHCLVFTVENMRNNHLQQVRKDLQGSRIFLGKTKLMSRALGHTPADEPSPNTHLLSKHLTGTVGLLFTSQPPLEIQTYFSNLTAVDFARAGSIAPRSFSIPPGIVYTTGGEVPIEHDVPMSHTIEPELRRLGVPVRMIKGKVVLGGDESGEGSEGYQVCKEGEVLDSRQTRLLKMFDVCMAEFAIKVVAYWSAATEEVVEVPDEEAMEA